MDGRLQRARVMGDTGAQRSGAYTGYLDGRPSGFLQNHKTGLKTTWTAAQAPQAVVDRATMAAEAAEKRRQREVELEKQYLIAGENAARIWASAAPAEAHPYLARKGVQAHGVRVATPVTIAEADRLYPPEDGRPGHAYSAGDLLVPVCGQDGALWTLQAIREDGRKGIGKGGRLAGGSFTIGGLDQAGPLVVAEGFATGATLHELTGQPVVIAFNAGNLGKVAEAYRARFPDRPLVIAGDNDHQAPRQLGPDGQPRKNVGAEKAREAAAAVQGFALLPAFDETSRGTDWNDLAQQQGIETTSALLAEGLGRAALQHGGLTAEREDIAQQISLAAAPAIDAFREALGYARKLAKTNPAIAAAALKDAAADLREHGLYVLSGRFVARRYVPVPDYGATELVYVLEVWVRQDTEDLGHVVDRSDEPRTLSVDENDYGGEANVAERWLTWEGKTRLALWRKEDGWNFEDEG